MAMTQEEIKQAKILAIILAVGAVGLHWFMLRPNARLTSDIEALNIAQMDSAIAVESAAVDSIRNLLRTTSPEEMEARIDAYRDALSIMRQLVPENNDVPTLQDNIQEGAARRGVRILDFNPQPSVENDPFTTQRWAVDLLGSYNAIGQWLSDVASLPQIMVATDLQISVADTTQLPPDLLVDRSETVVRANLSLETFVKTGTGTQSPDDAAAPQ